MQSSTAVLDDKSETALKFRADIHLISPSSSLRAIEAALSQNPHLTSLPLPRAVVLGPQSLTLTTGTAEVLRTKEIQAIIKGDFIVLPCDIVCDIPGEAFINAWMTQQQEAFGNSDSPSQGPSIKGALGLWYQTTGAGGVKGEETDFLITTPLAQLPPSQPPSDLHSKLSRLVYSTTSATLKDITGDEGAFPLRHSLMCNRGRVKALRTYRDSHIYILPHWAIDLIKRNPEIDSISEDLIGLWAKSGWQSGLERKLGFPEVLNAISNQLKEPGATESLKIEQMSSTRPMKTSVQDLGGPTTSYQHSSAAPSSTSMTGAKSSLVPAVMALVQKDDSRLVRRVDTAALLLHVSLHLAKLDSVEDVGRAMSSPLAHQHKLAHQSSVAPKSTVTRGDCLLAENVTVEEKCVIKESVIGANCYIKSGSRINRCVLMDGVVVGEKCSLTGCILGRRSQVGRESVLRDCEVQDGNRIPEQSDAKGEKFMIFEGLEGSEGPGSDNGEGFEAVR